MISQKFVATDLVSFEASLPILFGAGVGSTFISVLQVLSVTKYGMLLVSVGYFWRIYSGGGSGVPTRNGNGGGA